MLLKKSIIDMRVDESIFAEMNDTEYNNYRAKICQAQEKIKDLVPDTNQDKLYKAMMELEDAIGQSSLIELKEMYRQGFNDGLEIAAQLLRVKI